MLASVHIDGCTILLAFFYCIHFEQLMCAFCFYFGLLSVQYIDQQTANNRSDFRIFGRSSNRQRVIHS